jgi:hypothetical protein
VAPENDVVQSFYPIERHLSQPFLLHCVLRYLSYGDLMVLLWLNRFVRRSLTEVRELREEVLERYLRTVGYVRWEFKQKEPLTLSLKVGDVCDLHSCGERWLIVLAGLELLSARRVYAGSRVR